MKKQDKKRKTSVTPCVGKTEVLSYIMDTPSKALSYLRIPK